MSESCGIQLAALTSHLDDLLRHEMTATVHCAKINSLFQGFKVLRDILASQPPSSRCPNSKFAGAISSLVSSLDHLLRLTLQCTRHSFPQFVLMSPTQKVFEEFLEIRQTTIRDLKSLNYADAARAFVISPDQLLSQDQTDLKRIGVFLLQLRKGHETSSRGDIDDHITARLRSLQRKDIPIELGDADPIAILSMPPTLTLVLDHEQLVFKEQIGSGRSGRVFKGSIIGKPVTVAIKVLHCRKLSASELEMFRREIITLATLDHPSNLKLIGYTNTMPFCLVTEFLSNGSLFAFLKDRPADLSPTDRTVVALDVARGMEYVHERNIIHRDLKSLNILLDGEKHAKICDFGLVRIKSLAPMTGLVGTPQWMAPEVLLCSPYYDAKVDVFSYGIVLWELLTNETPYKDVPPENLGYLVVQDQKRPEIPERTPPELATLITACWAADPRERPTFSQIVALLNSPNYHFAGTNEDGLWSRCGGRRRKKSSISDPARVIDGEGLASVKVIARVDRLREAVANDNLVALQQALAGLRGLIRAPIPAEVMEEIIATMRQARPHQQRLILETLNGLLANSHVFETFCNAGGMEFVCELMGNDETSLAEQAMLIFVGHIRDDLATIESIKALLAFSGNADQRVREAALSGLFRIFDLKFDFLRTMPSLLHHLLWFPLKPLSEQTLAKLIDWTIRFLEGIDSFPEPVLRQLIGLHGNVPDSLKGQLVGCLVSAIRFDVVRENFPPEFWTSAAADFHKNMPVFQAFLGRLPGKFDKMIAVLIDLSSEIDEALRLLVGFARVRKCAQIVFTKLPIQNFSSPVLLFELYCTLLAIEGSELIIGEEMEFYVVCRLMIASESRADVCQRIRQIALNPVLLEASGLIDQIVLQISGTNDMDALWSLLSVVYTVSRDRFFAHFTKLLPKLKELVRDRTGKAKVAAFLCLANMAEHCEEINRNALLIPASEFVNEENSAVQEICCDFLRKTIDSVSPAALRRVTKYFLSKYDASNPKATEFASTLANAARQLRGFDQPLMKHLNSVAAL